MDEVVFHEEPITTRVRPVTHSKRKGFAEWMVGRGYARDTARANTYLILGAVLAVVAAFGILQFSTHTAHETRGGNLLFKRMPHAEN